MTRQPIFITGAASGIGRATEVQFHDRGWFAGATDVAEAGLASLSDQFEGDCFIPRLDVSD